MWLRDCNSPFAKVTVAATEVLMGKRNDPLVHGSLAIMARMLLAAAVCVGGPRLPAPTKATRRSR